MKSEQEIFNDFCRIYFNKQFLNLTESDKKFIKKTYAYNNYYFEIRVEEFKKALKNIFEGFLRKVFK